MIQSRFIGHLEKLRDWLFHHSMLPIYYSRWIGNFYQMLSLYSSGSGRNRHLLVLSLPMALAPSIYRADLAETTSALGNVGRWGFSFVFLDTSHLLDKTVVLPIDRDDSARGKLHGGRALPLAPVSTLPTAPIGLGCWTGRWGLFLAIPPLIL